MREESTPGFSHDLHVKDGQVDDFLKDKIVPWYPKFAMEMVNGVETLYLKCVQQYFCSSGQSPGS